MAASLVIEDERGVYTKARHPHNGYYAGDFSAAGPEDDLPSVSDLPAAARTWDATRWRGPWTR